MKRYFLFDLDGTIADNGEGILKSAQYALDAFGIHNEPEERLRRFVGPPLHQSFMEFYGFSQEQAFAAVEKYRERYRVKGVYENQLYPGVRALVEGSPAGPRCAWPPLSRRCSPGKSWRCSMCCPVLTWW